MGRRFIYIPNRVIDTNGISDGASIYVYQTGTTTLVSLYSDESLTTPISNPYVVTAGAPVPEIYHGYSGNIRVKVVASGGEVVSDDDPYQAPVTDIDLASTDPGKGAALVAKGYATLAEITPITPEEFGVFGADNTAIIRLAVAKAIETGRPLVLNREYTVSTFDQVLDDGTNCAIPLTDSVTIYGPGSITSSTVSVSNSVFGIDAAAGEASIIIEGVKFAGAARYRAINASGNAELNSIVIRDVETEAQSIIITSDVIARYIVSYNYLGTAITAASTVSPSLNTTLKAGSTNRPHYQVNGNTVVSGTEALSTGAFIPHNIPVGGQLIGNTHLNLAAADHEGYDIDSIGSFAQITNNVAYQSYFEYKIGLAGQDGSRDINFSNNLSYNSPTTGFNIRSSAIGAGNVAYNPGTIGFYLDASSDVDGTIDSSFLNLTGCRVIYAGSAGYTNAISISASGSTKFKAITLNNTSVELDPAWTEANPTSKIPGVQLRMTGDQDNVTISGIFIDKSAGDQIQARPTTAMTGLSITGARFGEAGDSCIDLDKCNDVVIRVDKWASTITDRPLRLTTSNRVQVTAPFSTNLLSASTTSSNTGVLINGYGRGAFGAATAPTADSRWPLGAFVLNTDDSSVWWRITESTTPASAWKQVA